MVFLYFSAFLNIFRLLFLSLLFAFLYPLLKKKSIYYFLDFSGPSFIKLGQTLSTRPDLIGKNLAQILSKFQDKVRPFSSRKVKRIIKNNFGNKLDEIFAEFNLKAKASASISQVHEARLNSGEKVAVKILRPKIKKTARRDILTLKILVYIIYVFSKNLSKVLNDINNVLKRSAETELNLMREAAMAKRFKKEMKKVQGFYVPQIYAQYCSKEILLLEWIDGIAFSDKEKILFSGFDNKKLAENFLIAYFVQVYQNGFFHADMHPGNLFLLKNGDIAVVDFGIMSEIDKNLRIAIAEILIAYINKDYEKVAKIHIQAGIVPKDVNLYELTVSCQKIGERMVGNSIKDISFSEVLKQLIEMTQEFKISTKPELLLLQKTIMLVEGTGTMLDEDLNIWIVAKPWVKEWAKKNISFDAKIRDIALESISAIRNIIKRNLS